MAERWTPAGWRELPIRQQPVYADETARAGVEEAPRGVAAAGVRRRGSGAARGAGRGRRGARLPAAGGRLRRGVRRVPSEPHPRHLPGAAADGGGAHLRRGAAGGQGGPHGGAVRQAALGADREPGRRRAAELPRRHRQRHRVRRRGARARSRTHAPGVFAGRLDAQPPARDGARRLRRPAPGPPLESRLPRRRRPRRALSGRRRPHRRNAGLHGRLRPPRGRRAADPPDRVLHLSRSLAARLRGGADPQRQHHGRLVRLLGAHAVDRRPHARPRRGARRLSRGREEPDRRQGRAKPRRRRPDAPHRRAQSRRRAGAPDADRAHGRRQGRRAAAAAGTPRRQRGPPGGVVVRPHARQYDQVVERVQDPPVRPHPGRGAPVLRRPRRRGDPCRRRSLRDDRPGT